MDLVFCIISNEIDALRGAAGGDLSDDSKRDRRGDADASWDLPDAAAAAREELISHN